MYAIILVCLENRSAMDESGAEVLQVSQNRAYLIENAAKIAKDHGLTQSAEDRWYDEDQGFTILHVNKVIN
jgi:hypothetical protein